MALIELLPSSELETKESTVASSSFLTNTIRSILFSTTSSAIGSEIDNKLKQFTLQDVSDHDSDNDCWIIIYDRVYDVTKFLDLVSIHFPHRIKKNYFTQRLSAKNLRKCDKLLKVASINKHYKMTLKLIMQRLNLFNFCFLCKLLKLFFE